MTSILPETLGASVYLTPEELPNPSEVVSQFQDALRHVTPTVVEFTSVLEDAERDTVSTKSITQLCVDGVKSVLKPYGEGGLYVESEFIAEEMEGMSELRISRTNIGETSAHQVFFASISDGFNSSRVAVKPFVYDPHKSIHEWANTLIAQDRGLKTFFPIGFILHDGKGYTLTLRQDDIEPMDNADWATALLNPEFNEAMLTDLQKLGPAIARLHDLGCYHGDFQLKNAVITETGSVHAIDWEAAVFIDRRKDQDDFIYKKTVRDLKVLFGSLARPIQNQGVGLLDGLTLNAQWSYFKDLILDPYLYERLQLATAGNRPDTTDQMLVMLGAAELELEQYILDGDLYKNLQRPR